MTPLDSHLFASNAALPEHFAWQILSFVRMQWYDPIAEFADTNFIPDDWHPTHVVLAQGQTVISYAGVMSRRIEHAGETYQTYGLSSVFTFPAFRGREFGRRVVNTATAHIDAAGDGDIALLFTWSDRERFYQRCGWETMPTTKILIGDQARPRVHDFLPMMRFLSAKGKAGKSAFDNAPLYVGETQW